VIYTKKEERAKREGVRAWHNDVVRSLNPYPHDGDLERAWLDGWLEADAGQWPEAEED
jgi:ribosome modulation factor